MTNNDMAQHIDELITYEDEVSESELIALNDMNHSEQFFMEGLYSEELPSERFMRRNDSFFPNHF